MKHFTSLKTVMMAFMLLSTVLCCAEEFVVEIQNFDSDKGTFTLKTYGNKPFFSSVDFYNDFGATPGNSYNQIPGEKEATLDLYGWDGCTIDSITFGMRSNKSAGRVQVMVDVFDDEHQTSPIATIYNSGEKDFNSADWYGNWVRYNHNVIVDITKEMTTKRVIGDEFVTITVTGGSKSGSSIYLDRFTIYYTPQASVELESAMPYKFTQLGKTDAIADGDVCVLVNGSHIGACDIVAGANPYMGTTSVGSYDEIWVPENNTFDYPALSFLEMKKADDYWYMIDQYGDTIGSNGLKSMCYNSGEMRWDITLGASYDGHTIASAKSGNGVIQYNYESPRFTTYEAGKQGKVFLLRRGEQQQPIMPASLSIESARAMSICTDTVILHPVFTAKLTTKPVTDSRVIWKSLDENVATVKDGLVRPVAAGSTKIVAISRADNELTDTCDITVSDCTVESVTIMDKKGKYEIDGVEMYICENAAVILTAAVVPANAPIVDVVWESLDSSIASVNDGKITAVAVGETDIVVTSVDGNKADTCHVIVKPCVIEGMWLKYDDDTVSLKACGDMSETREVIYLEFEPEFINPETDDVIWASSDTAIVTPYVWAGGCTLHAKGVGKATITATAANNASIQVEILVLVADNNCGLAVDVVEMSSIYAVNGRIYADGDFKIYDVTGRDVTELNGKLNGIYVVKQNDKCHKLVVK